MSAAVMTGGPDADQVRWLETVAAACERILARDEEDSADWASQQIRQDVQELLARVRAELDASPQIRAEQSEPDTSA